MTTTTRGTSASHRADACPPLVAPEPAVVGGEDPRAAGWARRFDADSARVEELAELYRSLGYEVQVRALAPESFGPQCAGCALSACSRYVELSTRRVEDPQPSPGNGTAPASRAVQPHGRQRWQPTS